MISSELTIPLALSPFTEYAVSTLAVGIFSADASFGVQLLGTLSIVAFTFVFSLIVFGAIKATVGVRVSKEVESDGLDISEHGHRAYPEFSPVKTSELGAFSD